MFNYIDPFALAGADDRETGPMAHIGPVLIAGGLAPGRPRQGNERGISLSDGFV
jgi:hypothetical protein